MAGNSFNPVWLRCICSHMTPAACLGRAASSEVNNLGHREESAGWAPFGLDGVSSGRGQLRERSAQDGVSSGRGLLHTSPCNKLPAVLVVSGAFDCAHRFGGRIKTGYHGAGHVRGLCWGGWRAGVAASEAFHPHPVWEEMARGLGTLGLSLGMWSLQAAWAS